MKYLVLSDTHGEIDRALRVARHYEKEIEGVIHLGDYSRDAEILEEELGCEVISVKGNCDGDYSGDFKVLDTPAGRILLTHGHGQKVKMSLINLIYRAQELDCSAALFGHTHVSLVSEEGGVLLVNPGSLTYPSDGSGGSFAMLDVSGDEPLATVMYYDAFARGTAPQASAPGASGNGSDKSSSGTVAKPATRKRSGHLRNLLNNSDRL